MENIERNRTVKYVLFSSALGELELKQEPKGYNKDTRSYERDPDSRGISYKTNINLEFFGEGADYLTTISRQYGISEKVLLTKYVKDNTTLTEIWKFRYTQELDMGVFELMVRKNGVTVGATQGGLKSDIENRITDTYDIIDTKSADGIEIGALVTNRFQATPRGIYTDNLLRDDKQTDYRVNSQRSVLFDPVFIMRSIPLKTVYNNIPEDIKEPWISDNSYNNQIPHWRVFNNIANEENMFFLQAEIERDLRIRVEVEFEIIAVDYNIASDMKLKVQLNYTNEEEVSGVNEDVYFFSKDMDITGSGGSVINDLGNQIGNKYSVSYDVRGIVYPLQSVEAVFNLLGSVGNGVGEGYMDVHLNVTKSFVSVQDYTEFAPIESRCVKPFDLFERIIAKITGKRNLFKSTIFGPGGIYENFVVDNGFFARGFPDSYLDADDNEKKIQFNTSFDDAFESYNYLEPLAWFIEIDGDKEVVRIEEATYTMKNFIGVSLPSVDGIKHSASKVDFFKTIKIGQKKEVEYERVNGLEEPNGQSEFTSHIKRSKSEYVVVTVYGIDPIGYELIRRVRYEGEATTDTNRDDDIWMHDTRVNSQGVHLHNLWADVPFDSAPVGIYDPATAWNLRLSPMNRLFYGHGYSIKRGLYHYPKAEIRFNSSNANQNMITTFNGKELAESGSIVVGDIPKSKVEAEKTELTFRLTQAIEDTLVGFTKIGEELVPNYFGLIEYRENGELRYGRLVLLEGEEQSNLTMINARL